MDPQARQIGTSVIEAARGLERVFGTLARDLTTVFEIDEEADEPALRGPVQKRIIRLPGIFSEEGMSAGEVAKTLDYDEPNTYAVLSSLEKGDRLEQVPGTSPRRWRAAVKHRRDRVLRLSRLIPEGLWTTYGDFAIAVYGNVKMARTVGRVAAKNVAFANPHRVLKAGGEIPPDWQDGEGGGPEVCVQRLESEGVLFQDGVADPESFIGWAKLEQLLEADDGQS